MPNNDDVMLSVTKREMAKWMEKAYDAGVAATLDTVGVVVEELRRQSSIAEVTTTDDDISGVAI